MKSKQVQCQPLFGSCGKYEGHRGYHDAAVKKKVYRCHNCGRRIRKNETWCQHCGANDEDE